MTVPRAGRPRRADFGQLTAAAMATQFRSPIAVWMGAVAAMLTKALFAATLGARIRLELPYQLAQPRVMYVSLALLVLIGALAVAETLFAQR